MFKTLSIVEKPSIKKEKITITGIISIVSQLNWKPKNSIKIMNAIKVKIRFTNSVINEESGNISIGTLMDFIMLEFRNKLAIISFVEFVKKIQNTKPVKTYRE